MRRRVDASGPAPDPALARISRTAAGSPAGAVARAGAVMIGPVLVAGLDLGSTGMKVLVTDEDGQEVLAEQVPTPWRYGPGGTTEMDAGALLATVGHLLHAAAHLAAARSDAPIEAVAISGMGETGMVVDARGHAVAPALPGSTRAAPSRPRRSRPRPGRVRRPHRAPARRPGQRGQARLPARPGAAAGGPALAQPARVRRGRARAATALEVSLTSRTGLLDQDTGPPWPRCSTPWASTRRSCRRWSTPARRSGGAGRRRRHLRRCPAHRRRARPPRRRRGRRRPARPTTTTSRWAPPRCCCGSSTPRSASRPGAASPTA